jgi:hypothetical protein
MRFVLFVAPAVWLLVLSASSLPYHSSSLLSNSNEHQHTLIHITQHITKHPQTQLQRFQTLHSPSHHSHHPHPSTSPIPRKNTPLTLRFEPLTPLPLQPLYTSQLLFMSVNQAEWCNGLTLTSYIYYINRTTLFESRRVRLKSCY